LLDREEAGGKTSEGNDTLSLLSAHHALLNDTISSSVNIVRAYHRNEIGKEELFDHVSFVST
jgi:hypothetical protein